MRIKWLINNKMHWNPQKKSAKKNKSHKIKTRNI